MRRSRDDMGANAYGMPALANAIGRHVGRQAQLLQPGGAEVLAIEVDLLVLVRRQAQHFQRDMLEGAQQFAAVFQD